MSWFPPDDFEAPPPAYEEDFDRKVALAVETSLSIQESAPAQDDGEWELWDEATFQANAAALERGSGASSSSASAPQPSADLQPPAAAKQKPSWYEEAGLGQSQSSSSQPPGPSTSQPVSPSRAQLPVPPPPPFTSQRQEEQPAVNHVHVLPPEPEDDDDEPLPPFTSVDGVAQEQLTVLSWTAASTSRTPSPLASPPMPTSALGPPSPLHPPVSDGHYRARERTLPSPPPPASSPPTIRQSMPPPHRPAQQRLGPRPMTTNYTTSGISQSREGVRTALPHVQFDPAVAYSNHRNNAVPIAARRPAAPVAASSFYNTSVSASMMAKQGGNAPQPSRHLPERQLPPDPRSVYDTNFHSPKPFRPYSNLNLSSPNSIPPPPPMPSYPQPSNWQQPQGGYNYYSR